MKALTVIGVVKASGLSRETLRYYEKRGLLKPQRQASNGYRLYAADDLQRLEFIFKTKKAGFTIRKIRELLEFKKQKHATGRLGRDIAREQIKDVDARVAALQDVRVILEDFARQCEKDGLDKPCSLSFHLKPILFDEEYFHQE
ncbi:MAG: MerR family transcriptional regulator [Nitrospirae bacterium]|nr:MerR family transcriptional regulator [Nitrospirota bacterium]